MLTVFPFEGYSARPCESSETKGVFSQIPGSAGEPKETLVVPSRASPAGSSTAKASARSSAVVVSNCSTVRADGGGGGGGVGSNVSAGRATGLIVGAAAAGAEAGASRPCKDGDSQAARAKNGSSIKRFISDTLRCPEGGFNRAYPPCAVERASISSCHDRAID